MALAKSGSSAPKVTDHFKGSSGASKSEHSMPSAKDGGNALKAVARGASMTVGLPLAAAGAVLGGALCALCFILKIATGSLQGSKFVPSPFFNGLEDWFWQKTFGKGSLPWKTFTSGPKYAYKHTIKEIDTSQNFEDNTGYTDVSDLSARIADPSGYHPKSWTEVVSLEGRDDGGRGGA